MILIFLAKKNILFVFRVNNECLTIEMLKMCAVFALMRFNKGFLFDFLRRAV